MFSFCSISPGNLKIKKRYFPFISFQKAVQVDKDFSSKRTLKVLLATSLRYFSTDPLYFFPKSTNFLQVKYFFLFL